MIIAVTGWGRDAVKGKPLAAGANAQLAKPVDPAALEHMLAALTSTTA